MTKKSIKKNVDIIKNDKKNKNDKNDKKNKNIKKADDININVVANKLKRENKKNKNDESIKNVTITITAHGRRYTRKRILTDREIEYLALASLGCRNHVIGKVLYVSESTVKKMLEKVFIKLNARDRANAAAIGFMYNILNENILNNMEKKMNKAQGEE